MASFTENMALMQKKQHLSKAFTTELNSLLDIITQKHLDNNEIITWVTVYSLFRKLNPKKGILYYNEFVYKEWEPHLDIINNRIDVEFFLDLDFNKLMEENRFSRFTPNIRRLAGLVYDAMMNTLNTSPVEAKVIYSKFLNCCKFANAYVKIDEK